jgi:hypothetical protein
MMGGAVNYLHMYEAFSPQDRPKLGVRTFYYRYKQILKPQARFVLVHMISEDVISEGRKNDP